MFKIKNNQLVNNRSGVLREMFTGEFSSRKLFKERIKIGEYGRECMR